MNGSLAVGMACLLSAGVVVTASLAALMVPQWRQQQSAHAGRVQLHLEADGSLRLWNAPVLAAQLPTLLERVRQNHPAAQVRVVPSPLLSWGEVQHHLRFLDLSDHDVELELPSSSRP
ncbi:MAG: hypothetical protein VKK03_09580 [Synechococcus sp.]|nr:hypothetical protein [Synechococcus sp.]